MQHKQKSYNKRRWRKGDNRDAPLMGTVNAEESMISAESKTEKENIGEPNEKQKLLSRPESAIANFERNQKYVPASFQQTVDHTPVMRQQNNIESTFPFVLRLGPEDYDLSIDFYNKIGLLNQSLQRDKYLDNELRRIYTHNVRHLESNADQLQALNRR
jgi:hypothetical protein